jgi:hypothetical protein
MISDSFIRSGIYSGNNYGHEATLEIKDLAVRGDFAREAFLKYDISPINTAITSAQLIVVATPDSLPLNIDVSVQPDNWNENTVIWNNQPQVGAMAGNIGTNGIANLNLDSLKSVWNDKVISFQLWDSRKTDQLFKIYSKDGTGPAPLLRVYHATSTTTTTGGSTTTTGSGPNTYDFYPVADAYVRGGASANVNFGNDQKLSVKSVAGIEDYNRYFQYETIVLL